MAISIDKFPKDISLDVFINRCDIPGVGIETARKIANAVRNITTLRDIIEEGNLRDSLKDVPGISESIIEALQKKFSNFEWLLLLDDMEEEGYEMFKKTSIYSLEELETFRSNNYIEEYSITSLPINLTGQKICITGTLSLPRKMFQQMIVNNGGVFQANVTKDTNILIFSKNDGQNTIKYRMAQDLVKKGSSISIITEETFLDKFSKKI